MGVIIFIQELSLLRGFTAFDQVSPLLTRRESPNLIHGRYARIFALACQVLRLNFIPCHLRWYYVDINSKMLFSVV